MGTICILVGLILLILFTFGGFYMTHAVIGNQLYMSLLAVKSTTMLYVYIVGACFVIGLLVCLVFAMLGLIYNRVSKNNEILRHITHH